MYLKSHHWVDEPYTAYEIRRSMRVRECRQTAICWDRKYLNIDTGKFATDKLNTLHALSWNDVTEPESETDYTSLYLNRNSWNAGKNLYIERNKERNDSKWFTPPDDDFDIGSAEEVIAPTFVREDNTPMICTVKKNCWIPK